MSQHFQRKSMILRKSRTLSMIYFAISYFDLRKNTLEIAFISNNCVISYLIYIFAKVLFQNMI